MRFRAERGPKHESEIKKVKEGQGKSRGVKAKQKYRRPRKFEITRDGNSKARWSSRHESSSPFSWLMSNF